MEGQKQNAEGAEKGSAEGAEETAGLGREMGEDYARDAGRAFRGRMSWGSFDCVRLTPDFAQDDRVRSTKEGQMQMRGSSLRSERRAKQTQKQMPILEL
jgi:hypothetical protein